MTAYDWENQPADDATLEAHDQAVETHLAHNRAVNEAAARLRAQRDARDLVRGEELADIELPEPYRLDTFLARPLEPVTHRIAGLMPMGARILLSAQWKAGKTTLRDNFVRSLVDGDPFLDRYEVTPLPEHGTVTILDFELDDQTLQRWLTDHQIENQDHVNVIPMRGRAAAFDIRDPHLRERWAKQLQQIGTVVIVLDCLRPILDALGLDESHDAGLFLVAFDALLAEVGAREALVIHHMGHSSERARGDSRLRDWPDAEWRLVRDKDPEDPTLDDPSGARYFAAYGRDVDHPQQELTYDTETRHISLRAGAGDRQLTAKRRKTAAACQTVMRVVHAQPGIGKRALLQSISGHNPTISEAIEQLVEDGLITRKVHGASHQYFPGKDDPMTVPTGITQGNTVEVAGRLYFDNTDDDNQTAQSWTAEPDTTPKPTTVPTVPSRAQTDMGTDKASVPRPLGRGTLSGTPGTPSDDDLEVGTVKPPPLRGFANQTDVPFDDTPEESW